MTNPKNTAQRSINFTLKSVYFGNTNTNDDGPGFERQIENTELAVLRSADFEIL